MNNPSKPIHIVGAGPAGLCSAIILAKAGKEVHLHERYDCIGKRFQGDLQGLENWSDKHDILQLLNSYGIVINFEAVPFHQVTLSDGSYSFGGSCKEPLFYLVKRGPFEDSLDTGLCRQAVDQGVHIHYRSTFPLEEADIVSTGPLRQALIAADKGLAFQTDLPDMAIGIFHDHYAYLGYSYLLVAQGYGCLCTVVFKDFHRLNECFENTIKYAKQLEPKLNLDSAHPVGGIGSFALNDTAQVEHPLHTGEAGGFQDLLWGFGIRTAMVSGYLAAQSLLGNKNYSEEVQHSLQPYLKASIVNRFLWETLKLGPRPLVPFLVHMPCSIRTNFRLLYTYTPIHKMLFPFALKYVKKHYPNSFKFNRIFQ